MKFNLYTHTCAHAFFSKGKRNFFFKEEQGKIQPMKH